MEDSSISYNEDASILNNSKKMQYAKIHAELEKLAEKTKKFESNLKVTAEQMPSFRKMANFHTALFMSAQTVLGEPEPSTSNNTPG